MVSLQSTRSSRAHYVDQAGMELAETHMPLLAE